MKSKSFLSLLLCLPLLITGCQLGCTAEKVISEKLAGGIATSFACTNQAQIQADVLQIMDVVKFCAVNDKHCEHLKKLNLKEGPIAQAVCPIAASAAVSILGSKIPADWQCAPTSPLLVTAVTTACEALPF